MRRDRNAKIVATPGRASSSPEVIQALLEARSDAFRLDFRHGDHTERPRPNLDEAPGAATRVRLVGKIAEPAAVERSDGTPIAGQEGRA